MSMSLTESCFVATRLLYVQQLTSLQLAKSHYGWVKRLSNTLVGAKRWGNETELDSPLTEQQRTTASSSQNAFMVTT